MARQGIPGAGRIAAGLVLALLLPPVLAAAQESPPAQAPGAPIQLIPGRPGTNDIPPAPPAAPSAIAPAAPAPAAAPAQGPSELHGYKGIEVEELGGGSATPRASVPPAAAAPARAGAGAVDAALWRGISYARLEALLEALPTGIPSPALHALAERLLLAPAALSDGPPDGAAHLLALRARKLAEMGDAEGVKALLAAAPDTAGEEALARVSVETRLLDGKTDAVCAEMGSLIHSYHSLFWQELQVFCQALAKKSQEVDLGLGLLREEGGVKDAAYFTLIDAIMGQKPVKLASLAAPSPLMLVMMRAAKQTLPEEALHNAPPAVLRAIAENPDADGALRLAAAERAVLAGALSGTALARIYDGITVSSADLQNALSEAQAAYGPRARVLLYRAAKAETVPVARAEALRISLSLARAANAYALALAVDLPFIAALPPAPELAFFAAEAGRALVNAGDDERAEGWFSLADSAARSTGPLPDAATELWPYGRLLASEAEPDDNRRFLAWLAAEKAAPGAPGMLAEARAARLLGLTAALGAPLSGVSWQPLAVPSAGEQAAMPPLPVWQELSDAVAAGRRGEAELLVLIAIGAEGTVSANPIALDGAIADLHRLGQERDARRLAVEAAIAAGL